MATCEVMFTIFSKKILDLRDRTERVDDLKEKVPGDDPSDKDLIDVINPKTGLTEKIRRDDGMIHSSTVRMDSKLVDTGDQVNLLTYHLLFGSRCRSKPEERQSKRNK